MKTTPQPTTHDAIATRAYHLWENGGRADGRDLEFWLVAEQELETQPEAPGSIASAGKGAARSPAARKGRVAR